MQIFWCAKKHIIQSLKVHVRFIAVKDYKVHRQFYVNWSTKIYNGQTRTLIIRSPGRQQIHCCLWSFASYMWPRSFASRCILFIAPSKIIVVFCVNDLFYNSCELYNSVLLQPSTPKGANMLMFFALLFFIFLFYCSSNNRVLFVKTFIDFENKKSLSWSWISKEAIQPNWREATKWRKNNKATREELRKTDSS